MNDTNFFSVPIRLVSVSAVRHCAEYPVWVTDAFALGADCVMADVSASADGSVQCLCSDGAYPLEAILAASADTRFILNVSGVSCAGPLCALLRRTDAGSRVLVSSANSEVVHSVRRLIPSCATAFTQGEALFVFLLAKTGLLFLKKKFPGDAIILSEYAGGLKILSAPFIREMTSKGVHVFAWGIDSSSAAKRLIDAGAGVITSKIKEVSTGL
jgi:glycerophosphoryl diester phosphodiesterase